MIDIQQLINYIFEHELDDFITHLLNDCNVDLEQNGLTDLLMDKNEWTKNHSQLLDKAATLCQCHIYGCAVRVWQKLYKDRRPQEHEE